MSAKWLITDGYGLSPASPKYIVTMGLVPDGAAPPEGTVTHVANWMAPTFGIYSLTLFFIVWFKWP